MNIHIIDDKLLYTEVNITIIWFNEHLLTINTKTKHTIKLKHYNKQVHDTYNYLGNNRI